MKYFETVDFSCPHGLDEFLKARETRGSLPLDLPEAGRVEVKPFEVRLGDENKGEPHTIWAICPITRPGDLAEITLPPEGKAKLYLR